MGSRLHVLYILKTISQVANEGMVYMLEHASLTNDIAHTFGTYDYERNTRQVSQELVKQVFGRRSSEGRLE